ncbi:helix-turn-helix transcriptional regulator [Sulfurospirillum cavolei]|uniref:helix-turn-helix transcriptional regulator n=1 Tax=Sulfurospirillum cavolei TaxID=366522 RepID=UPI003FA1EF01
MQEERFIRIPKVMEKTGLARSTIWLFVKKGKLPKPIKLSQRVTVWKESEISAYINLLSKEK